MKLIYHRTNENRRVCLLALEGRKWIHVIPMDSGGIRVQRIAATEFKWISDVPNYPIRPAAERFLESGRKFGITAAAHRRIHDFLEGAGE